MAKQRDDAAQAVGAGLVPAQEEAAGQGQAQPLPATSKMLRVSLRPGCGRDVWSDPQTHLVVTAKPQDVEARLVGKACRREVDVLITEV